MSLAGEERKKLIMDEVEAIGKVSVDQLAKQFTVSRETIRRYLNELEDQGKLKKVYGGAVKPALGKVEPTYTERENKLTAEKSAIGKAAAALIRNNEFIFIDEGSTALQIVPHLHHIKNPTILTNSFSVANLLMQQASHQSFTGKTIFLGGEVNPSHLRSSGPFAEKMLEQFHVDKAFISIDGMMHEYGISSIDAAKASLSARIMSIAKESVIVTDHTKINVRDYFKIADLKDASYIVCNKPAPASWSAYLKENKISWVTAK